jgi:SAM-dependent methyltransferase/RimJ/RimL family protein N-acetyltransferase
MALTWRRPGMDDAALLWRWANDSETRGNAFDHSAIPYNSHLDWMQARLASPATLWWIFFDAGEPIGQVRFDLTGTAADIDISVAPEGRGRGYGRAMLLQAIRNLRDERDDVRPRAAVLAHNTRSLAMFRACGFVPEGVDRRNGEDAIVLELRHTGTALDEVNAFTVIDCQPCGFKHVLPVPTVEETEALYRQTFYRDAKPLEFDRQRQDLDWWNLTFADRYDTFERHLRPDQRTILDVGCGAGFFLLHGQRRGWNVTGLEPSAQGLEHCRGLGVTAVEGFLDDSTANRLGRFDVVHLSEVLEHLPDPRGAVRLLTGLVNPGGLICTVVPNDYSPVQGALRTQGFKPWWIAPPHHLNYFDRRSLARLLEGAGFEIVLEEATFPIDLFLLMGENYVGDDVLGRQVHGRRKRLEQALAQAGLNDLKRQLYQAMAALGMGREIQTIARIKSVGN